MGGSKSFAQCRLGTARSRLLALRLLAGCCAYPTLGMTVSCTHESDESNGASACAGPHDICDAAHICPAGYRCMGGSCQLDLNVDPEVNLSTELQVAEFDLHRSTDPAESSTTFIWDKPRGAEEVVCALFVCSPRVEAKIQGDRTRRSIVNFEQCAAATRIFRLANSAVDRSEFSLPLGSMTRRDQKQCLPPQYAASLAGDSSHTIVSSVGVGCWAFGDTRIIAATNVLPVAPSELRGFSQLPVPECAESSDALEGASCFVKSTPGYCFDERCVETGDAGIHVEDTSDLTFRTAAPANESPDAAADTPQLPDASVGERPADDGTRDGTAGDGASPDRPTAATDGETPAALDAACEGLAAELPLQIATSVGFACGPDDDLRACFLRNDVGVCRQGQCLTGPPRGERLPLLLGDCTLPTTQDTETFSCFPATAGGVGTCHSGRCANRCEKNGGCLRQEMCLLTAEMPFGLCVPDPSPAADGGTTGKD